MIAASASGPSVLGISTRYCAPSGKRFVLLGRACKSPEATPCLRGNVVLPPLMQVSFHVSEAPSMCGDVASERGVMDPHIVYQYTGSALVGGEHLIVCRHEQLHTRGGSQVGGLAFIQVAHDVELLAEIASAIDREQRNIHCKLAQALDQAVKGNGVAGGIYPDACHLNDVTEKAVEALTIMLDETKVVDGGRCFQAVQGRNRKEFNLAQVQFFPGLNTHHALR